MSQQALGGWQEAGLRWRSGPPAGRLFPSRATLRARLMGQPAIGSEHSCRWKAPLMLSTPTRAPSHLLPAMLEQAIHGHRCLCNALLLVEENWGACSTRHESPSRLLRRFRRRAPPRKGACGLPNHRTSLLFLTALQEFETRLLLCRPKRIARLKPNR